MKELLDLKKFWELLVSKWKESFGWIILSVVAVFFGMELQQKKTTDDCRVMGSFRDGTQSYSCQVRVRWEVGK